MTLFAALMWLTTAASALDGNDALAIELIEGRRVEGWFYSCADGVLTLSGDDTLTRLPVATIRRVERDGEPLPMPQFLEEVDQLQRKLDQFRASPPPHPPPGLVAASAVFWAGGPHAMVGDWRRAAAYSLVEGVLIGTAVANIRAGGGAVLLPLAGLDLLFKGYAAGEAVRVTRRRREMLRPSTAP